MNRAIAGIAMLLVSSSAQAEWELGHKSVDEVTWRLNYLGFSEHHGSSNTTNETHHGFGISATVPDNFTYGIMHYKNSYGDPSTLFSVSTELLHYDDLHFGVGAGYVTGYGDNLSAPFLGFGTIRYKWVIINTVPSEVTAVGLTIPLEEIKRLFK